MRNVIPKPLHDKLLRLLRARYREGAFDQTSLAHAIGKTQSTAGQYLTGKKAGTLDLDEADAALRHAGSSLHDFIADVPPSEMTDEDRLARALLSRPDLRLLVEDLLDVPRPQLAGVRAMVRELVLPAIGKRAKRDGGSRRAPTQAPHTTAARAPRQSAPNRSGRRDADEDDHR